MPTQSKGISRAQLITAYFEQIFLFGNAKLEIPPVLINVRHIFKKRNLD